MVMEYNRTKTQRPRVLFLILLSNLVLTIMAQTIEPIPFGDFEQWATRNIKESGVFGGNTKSIYNIGPQATIEGSKPYDYSQTIWCSSNTVADIIGMTKTSTSVRPEHYEGGTCARLETVLENCKVIGIINVKALSAGSILWGDAIEPLTSLDNPYSFYNWGIPFTKRPTALIVDFKAHINPNNIITHVSGNSLKTSEGEDPAEFRLLLQQRWEDADGNIYAKRVGTAEYLVKKSTDGWLTEFRIPVVYGDAHGAEGFNPLMDITNPDNPMYARNSKGKMVKIQEIGWAERDAQITHAVLLIASGCQPTFSGMLGNILWIDNLKLEY